MLQLTSDRFFGPLKDLKSQPFYVRGFEDITKVSIGFIGHTYAGKTQYIRTLTNTLGGVFQEKQNYNKRTTADSSYIFGEVETKGIRKIIALQLKSHAGHDIGYGVDGPNAEYSVLVFKYLKSSTFNRQFVELNPILEKENISIQNSYGLVTRVNSDSELTTRRRNMLLKKGLKDIFYIDNRKRKNFDLNNFDSKNVDLILKVLEVDYPSLKLIYFGQKSIPNSLEDRVVNFDNHFLVPDVPKEGFRYDLEDTMADDIWREMQEAKIIF